MSQFSVDALSWWLAGDEDDALSEPVRAVIGDEINTVTVSAASPREVATKFRLRKLLGAALLARDLESMELTPALTNSLFIRPKDVARLGAIEYLVCVYRSVDEKGNVQ